MAGRCAERLVLGEGNVSTSGACCGWLLLLAGWRALCPCLAVSWFVRVPSAHRLLWRVLLLAAVCGVGAWPLPAPLPACADLVLTLGEGATPPLPRCPHSLLTR